MSTLIGLLLVLLIILAIFFAVKGEELIDNLRAVKRIRSVRSNWGKLTLDLAKLTDLHNFWERRPSKDVVSSLMPTRIKDFCTLKVSEVIVPDLIKLNRRDGLRQISDVIRVVSYPDARLARITHELRLYAGLLAILFLVQSLKEAPQIAQKLSSVDILKGCELLLQILGEKPLDYINWVEVAILAIFTTRFFSELSNLRQYIK